MYTEIVPTDIYLISKILPTLFQTFYSKGARVLERITNMVKDRTASCTVVTATVGAMESGV